MLSCLVMTPWTAAYQVPLSMGFPRQEFWNGLQFLLQGIFLTQGSNPCPWDLLHWQVDSLFVCISANINRSLFSIQKTENAFCSVSFFFNFLFYFGWLTMLSQFQVYSRVIQLYICMCLSFLKFFSLLGGSITLSRVFCPAQCLDSKLSQAASCQAAIIFVHPHPLVSLCSRIHGRGTSLMVQWLRLYAPNTREVGSIPCQGTKIPHATQCGKK